MVLHFVHSIPIINNVNKYLKKLGMVCFWKKVVTFDIAHPGKAIKNTRSPIPSNRMKAHSLNFNIVNIVY